MTAHGWQRLRLESSPSALGRENEREDGALHLTCGIVLYTYVITHTHTHTHMCVHASCVCVRVVRVRVGCVHCASYCASDVLRAPAQPGTSAAAGVPPCADGRSSL